MNTRLRDIAVIAFAAGMLLMLALSGMAHATQPECTGDRHYDGVACCPEQNECPTCEECPTQCPPPACPDPAPCQPVTCTATCEDGQPGTTTVVEVARQDAPIYVLCNGPHKKPKKGDVWINEYQGWYHCPGKGVPPHKILLPKFAGSYEQ